MKVYGLKTCDSCRKALRDLSVSGREMELIEMRSDEVTKDKIEFWLSKVGAESLVNRRSTTWRGLSEAEKEQAAGQSAAALLERHRTLIKRPVVETGDEVFVGWAADTKQALL